MSFIYYLSVFMCLFSPLIGSFTLHDGKHVHIRASIQQYRACCCGGALGPQQAATITAAKATVGQQAVTL